MNRTGSPRLASTAYRTPATPATFASSCGSVNTVVVPRGQTASAYPPGVSIDDSKCTCMSMKPGVTKRSVQSMASNVSVRAPRSCTLATSGPTMPTSAARNSPHPTSTSVPPVSSRSNGAFPWAAATARRRIVGSTASLCIALSSRRRPARRARGLRHELGENAAKLDRDAVGLDVYFGRDIEREPQVAVTLLQPEVLVDDLAF